MFSQVRQALDSLAAALDGVGSAPAGELREALALAKPLRARIEMLETAVASRIAACERHGDGGAGVLHQVAAVPRSDAARNVRAAAELERVPAARTALADGEMCMANAARLARAARSVSPEAVQGDADLVEQAKTLPPDEFAHASQRWTAQQQNAAGLAERHRRNRRNRNVRFWNGEDGTVQMRGAFDAEMGARIQTRIRDEAERLRQADRRLQRTLAAEKPGTASGGDYAAGAAALDATVPDNSVRGDTPHGAGAVRTRDQRMADALDTILTRTARDTSTGCSHPDGADPDPSDLVAADPTAAGAAANGTARCDETTPTAGCGAMSHEGTGARCSCAASDSAELGGADSVAHTRPSTQVIVRADLADLLGGSGIGEIAGTGPVPGDVVDRLCCNAEVSIVLFDTELNPVYEAVLSRAPTAAQRRALIARDGGCIGCGAPPGECEAHHIIPWQRRGPTRIDNLVLVCWSCHDKIHDHNWQVVKRKGRYRLRPPDPTSAPNPARSRKPASPNSQPRTGTAARTGERARTGKPARTGERARSAEPAQPRRPARSGAAALFP